MLTYCTRCVMPATKPDLQLDDDGVCITTHDDHNVGDGPDLHDSIGLTSVLRRGQRWTEG